MSVSINATDVLAQNGLTTADFELATVESMIDDCLNTCNLLFQQDMDAMTGESEAKTVSVTRNQSAVVKMLITLVLRENKKTQLTGSSSTGGTTSTNHSLTMGPISAAEGNSVSTAISAATAINNPVNSVFVDLFLRAGGLLPPATSVTTKEPPIYIGTPSIPTT